MIEVYATLSPSTGAVLPMIFGPSHFQSLHQWASLMSTPGKVAFLVPVSDAGHWLGVPMVNGGSLYYLMKEV